jgi:hypothetical protein
MTKQESDEKLLEALGTGAEVKVACNLAGITVEAVETRIKKEKTFAGKVAESIATAEIECVRTILEAAQKGDWRAAAWFLERRGHGFNKSADEQKKPQKRELKLTVKKIGRVSRLKRQGAKQDGATGNKSS